MSNENTSQDIETVEKKESSGSRAERECCYVVDPCGCYVDPCCAVPSFVCCR